jgi:hypothetical protein
VLVEKRLGKSHSAVIKAAADHLDDMAGLDEKGYSRTHKAACAHHGKALRSLLKAAEEACGGGGIDVGKVLKALQPLREKAAEIEKGVYRITGRKAVV